MINMERPTCDITIATSEPQSCSFLRNSWAMVPFPTHFSYLQFWATHKSHSSSRPSWLLWFGLPTLSCGRDLPPRAWVLSSTSALRGSPGTKCQVSPWAYLALIECGSELLDSLYLPPVLPESRGLHLPVAVTFFLPTLIHWNDSSHIFSSTWDVFQKTYSLYTWHLTWRA